MSEMIVDKKGMIREIHDIWMKECNEYFYKLAERLNASHRVVTGKSGDISKYLVVTGTENQLTYYGKPFLSFRLSNHWNWKANLRKCVDPNHVQCYTKDLHHPFRRPDSVHASKPVYACCVGYYGPDRLYHIICGEVFDPSTKATRFIKKDIDEVIRDLEEDSLSLWESRVYKMEA